MLQEIFLKWLIRSGWKWSLIGFFIKLGLGKEFFTYTYSDQPIALTQINWCSKLNKSSF